MPGGPVWYAAYGSNLSRTRFDVYLKGGRPDGAAHDYPGCRDTTPPQDDVASEVAGQLAFGGWSQTWGGGVALLRDARAARTRARLYLLSIDQFEDVVAQENWLLPGTVVVETSTEQTVLDAEHTYRVVLPLGARDGLPVLTVTQLATAETNAPTPAYLRHIAEGLVESHGMTAEEVVDYLSKAPGAPPPGDIAGAVS